MVIYGHLSASLLVAFGCVIIPRSLYRSRTQASDVAPPSPIKGGGSLQLDAFDGHPSGSIAWV